MKYAVLVLERERSRISGIIKTYEEAIERGEYIGYVIDINAYQKQLDDLDESIHKLNGETVESK